MSSLRLALKQSLQETGHLAPKEKKKKSSSFKKRSPSSQNPLRRKKRQSGDPPRKRGRPRKHPRPDDSDDPDGSGSRNRASDEEADGDHDSESHFSSENELSYDSEDSQEDGEEEEEGEEQEEKHSYADQDGEDDIRGHPVGSSHDEEEEGEIEEHDDTVESRKMKKSTVTDAGAEGEDGEVSSSEDDHKKQKKLKKELKHSAAHKIQSQWKKKRDHVTGFHSVSEETIAQSEQASTDRNVSASPTPPAEYDPHKEAPNSSKKKRRDKNSQTSSTSNGGSGRSKTVPPPAPEILEWARGLSEKKWRKHIEKGLRVKVRFATKVKRDGKVIKKKKWYGGLVSAVSREGSKIKIKYDDGTSEVSKFPDKDVVVDAESNGEHLVSAEKFLPPPPPVEEGLGEKQAEAEKEGVTAKEAVVIDSTKHNEEFGMPVDAEVQPMEVEGRDGPGHSGKIDEVVENAPNDVENQPVDDGEQPNDPAEGTKTPSKLDCSGLPDDDTRREVVAQTIQLTPVAMVPVLAKNELQTPKSEKVERRAPISNRDQGSPEEGELSPGLTFSKDAPKRSPGKPLDIASLDPDLVTNRPAADLPQPTTVALPDLSREAEKLAPGSGEKALGVSTSVLDGGKPKQSTPKLSLTIRIPNVKQDQKQSALKGEENEDGSDKPWDAANDGEVPEESQQADREKNTIEGEEVKVIRDEGPVQQHTTSRKRALSDTPIEEDAPPTKKRIHLKRADPPQENRDETPIAEEASISETFLQLKSTAGSDHASLSAEIPPTTDPEPAAYDDGNGKGKKDRKTSAEAEDGGDDQSAPSISIKLKLKKDSSDRSTSPHPRAVSPRPRATSPKPRNARRSPNPRRSPAADRAESPSLMSSDPKLVEDTQKPMSKPVPKSTTIKVPGLGTQSSISDSSIQENPLILTGSKNSAFERKHSVNGEEGGELHISAPLSTSNGGELMGSEGKPSTPKLRERSKTSAESQTAARSGRRAAQAAKEKINGKNDTPGMEGKKKKKRRRKEGKESDEEESETSEDDRQWVQCDSCGKWRILPSSVKVSSLPKHWYCSMNEYDPKRNSCDAPEQTPKQVAKERKRAKKRAKRMEQAELEAIPEESRKEQKGRAETAKEPVSIPLSGPGTKEVSSKDSANSVGESNNKSKRPSPVASVGSQEEPRPSDSGSESQKEEKKPMSGKKSKVQEKPQEKSQEGAEESEALNDSTAEPPKPKPGRRRGRPRNVNQPSGRGSAQENRDEGDNVEWVQCEKCDKWRKLPPHICADELPDVWYCSLNTWNADSASCESPEDKADALHQDVGSGNGVPGNPGKFSYRGLIFGTGRKQNRPMSERTRAAESLFARPVDDTDNPYPVVMYAKSSAFLPRTSNFTKSNAVEEKCTSVFDMMDNSGLWAELRGISKPIPILSSSFGHSPMKHLTFESLPEDMKKTMREIVLTTLGSSSLTGDAVLYETQHLDWDNLPPAWLKLKDLCTPDIVVNTLLELVRGGVLEMACSRDFDRPMGEWVPKYRQVRSRRKTEVDEAMKASRCMKISKPWKQRENDSEGWISGKGVLPA